MQWTKTGTTDSDDETYDGFLFSSYKLINGKIIPGEQSRYFWGSRLYYINDGKIKRFTQVGSKYVKEPGGERQVIIYDIYDGNIIEKYR